MNPDLARRVIVALDEMTLAEAAAMVKLLLPTGCRFKVGMQLHGRFASRRERLQDFLPGANMMLDLKRHDIPNTVLNTVREDLEDFHPAFYTINLPWNEPSFARVVKELAPQFPDTVFLGITVLTSLGDGLDGKPNDIMAASGNHFHAAQEAVEYYATRAVPLSPPPNLGLVCSPQELPNMRGNPRTRSLKFVCPGIRPAGSAANDQSRIATPVWALEQGAYALVIGRPITKDPHPRAALERICAQIAAAT